MSKAIRTGTVIEHPGAYAVAIRNNIVANARKTFERTYEDARAIDECLNAGRDCDDYGHVTYKAGFMGSLAMSLDKYGKLTERQVEAVRKVMAERAARRAEWESKEAALNALRRHLGTVGEKVTLTLTLCHSIALESQYGVSYLLILEDAERNVVIYKGNSDAMPYTKGETATVVATVKEHGVRDGVKQTIIQRPKKLLSNTI